MSRLQIHFVTVPEPLQPGRTRNGDCGAEIPNAVFVFVLVVDDIGDMSSITNCKSCVALWQQRTAEAKAAREKNPNLPKERGYIYGAINPQLLVGREQEAEL